MSQTQVMVVGDKPLPLDLTLVRGTPLVYTLKIGNDWVIAPTLVFPDQSVTWTSTIVSGYPYAAQWDEDSTQVELIPHLARVELHWDQRVLARGVVKRLG